jgi:hypothetical protein
MFIDGRAAEVNEANVPDLGIGTGRTATPDIERDVTNIRLIRIAPGPRAQIETQNTKRWYSEGDKIGQFLLLAIDPETKCCRISNEATGEVIEACIDDVD